ncbi:TetR/AcrR family transcriptional regulator [Saliterribacillus persicus]|uniref:TetR family transcriptional regulator n=1 Tax=Saliterribacillus persicus TaxID=930114 RepID=A0A368X595_9BACI|nr:TetR/AcrR family transcriptional regulator [Saliterribacillus persicus]RCW62869.1 TetR family transcriptional regulator [Saliterribacillus persicus]
MNNKLSLRERKKYQTMSNILDEFLNSLQDYNFHDIHIEDICDRVNISKVTFFRYFNSKEEVLEYFVLRWCYQRSLEINRNDYKGLEGIHHVFQSVANLPNAEKIIISLIHFYTRIKVQEIEFKELSEYERYVISNSLTEGLQVDILNLPEILLHYLDQIEGIEKMKSYYVEQLIMLFYGIPLQRHIQVVESKPLDVVYREYVENCFSH